MAVPVLELTKAEVLELTVAVLELKVAVLELTVAVLKLTEAAVLTVAIVL